LTTEEFSSVNVAVEGTPRNFSGIAVHMESTLNIFTAREGKETEEDK